MVKILFVCHGNICRSPMAEFVMKDLVKKAGLQEKFHIASAAVSREELGRGSCSATGLPATVMPPIRSLRKNMPGTTMFTIWTGAMPGT